MNWGKGITIFIIAFMLFIGLFVWKAFTLNADLIDEDYYENELTFDQRKTEKLNYDNMTEPITVEQKENGITFFFPTVISPSTEGQITFYRPDDKRFDREFSLAVNDNREQEIAYNNFVNGYYQISVHWNDSAGKGFIFESDITFE